MKLARTLAAAATIAFASGSFASSPESELGSGLKAPPDVWLVATVASWHADRHKNYNEANLGLGLEYHINEKWHLAAGVYQNSYYEYSGYFGVGYELYRWKIFYVGVALVGLSGYTQRELDWVLAPAAGLEYKCFGVNLVPFTPDIVGIQLKYKMGCT